MKPIFIIKTPKNHYSKERLNVMFEYLSEKLPNYNVLIFGDVSYSEVSFEVVK